MTLIYIDSPFYEDDLSIRPIATISTPDHCRVGSEFFTEAREPLQVGRLCYPAGHVVEPHHHPPKRRNTFNGRCQEALVILRGRLLCHFWDDRGNYMGQWTAGAGSVVRIVGGGHSFEALEEVEAVEVKLGPHDEGDKVPI